MESFQMAKEEYLFNFQIRHVGDRQPWEDLPLATSPRLITEETAKKWACVLANDKNVVEVRWNISGSLQGHYVPGPAEARKKHRG